MQEKVGLLGFWLVQPLVSCDVQQELWVKDGAFMEILSSQYVCSVPIPYSAFFKNVIIYCYYLMLFVFVFSPPLSSCVFWWGVGESTSKIVSQMVF